MEESKNCIKCKIILGKKFDDPLKKSLCKYPEYKNFEIMNLLSNEKKKNLDYSICLLCLDHLKLLSLDSNKNLFQKYYDKEYIELLKLRENPDLFFEKIDYEKNNKELNMESLMKENITNDDEKNIKDILDTDEAILELEKENYLFNLEIENQKKKIDFFSEILNCKNDNLETILNKKNYNSELSKILLKRFYSSINYKDVLLGKANEWGKILHLTEIICRLKNIDLGEHKIYVMGEKSFFVFGLSPISRDNSSILKDNFKVFTNFLKFIEKIFELNEDNFNENINSNQIEVSEKIVIFILDNIFDILKKIIEKL